MTTPAPAQQIDMHEPMSHTWPAMTITRKARRIHESALYDETHTASSLLALGPEPLLHQREEVTTFLKGAKEEVHQIVRGFLLEKALG